MLRKKEKVQTQRKRKGFNFLKLLFFFTFFSIICLSSSLYTHNASAQESNLKQNQAPDNKELGNLEEKVFHQSFSSESKESRVSRLENFLFGNQNPKESIENRIKKITTALKTPEIEQPVIKPEPINAIKPETIDKTPPPQESTNNEGIIGAINQIEIKMFNMTFNEYPFQSRISSLEDRLLSKKEISTTRAKPLLERVTILINKAGLQINQNNVPINNAPQGEAQNQKIAAPRSYSINPNTGLLINDKTGETVKDNNGQPISVMLPQYLPQQNYGYQPLPQNPLYQNNPYGNQFNQNPGIPSPYDFLFNRQNNGDPGESDPGY